jgi:sigma-E factor negative regulatory protein RseB
MRAAFPAFLILLGSVSHAGADSTAPDAIALLKKIAAASRRVNYAGTFVYQHANQVETSRIAHFADPSGEYEKLETLDGPPREIMRNNDNVTCYLPETKTVVVEKRTARRFPALLPDQLVGISDNYTVRKGEEDRVAGFACRVIVLEPKDNLRYGHKFCVETVSGLPLRARMYNEKNEMVESFAFTQLTIGSGVSKDMIKSRFASKSQSWRVDRSALQQSESPADIGWVLKNQPVGFKKLTEMRRSIAGRSAPISHIVYSDGLAAVSVFIEPLPKTPPPDGPTYQGAVNIFIKAHNDQMVTVVGETPARTVKQIAESLSPRER